MKVPLQHLSACFFGTPLPSSRASWFRLRLALPLLFAALSAPAVVRSDDIFSGFDTYGGEGDFGWTDIVNGVGDILNNVPMDDGGYDEEGGYYPGGDTWDDGGDYYEPQQPQYIPQEPAVPQVPRNVAPPGRSTTPVAQAPRSIAPIPHTRSAANTPLELSVVSATKQDITTMINKTLEANEKLVSQLTKNKLDPALVDNAVAQLPGLNDKERKDLQDAIKNGKPADVRRVLEGKKLDPRITNGLVSMAQVNGWIDQVAAANAQSLAQLQALGAAVTNLNNQLAALNQQIAQLNQQLAAQQQAIRTLTNQINRQTAAINQLTRAIGQLIRNRTLVNILRGARPGVRRIPAGNGVVIVRVPGMNRGTVTPLGPGAVLMGSGPTRGGRSAGPSSITVGNVSRAAGLGMTSANPIKDATDQTSRGVVLLNMNDNPISFVVDDRQTLTLQPQHFQAFLEGKQGVVSFDRGNGETARYTVTEGTYEFTATEKGWELYRKTYKATIDNSENPNDFQFVLGTQKQIVPAGQAKEFTSPYVLAIRFDDGQGQVREKRLMSGEFKVATSSSDGALDLFAAAEYAAGLEGGNNASQATEPSDAALGELLAKADPGQLSFVPDPDSIDPSEDIDPSEGLDSGELATADLDASSSKPRKGKPASFLAPAEE